MGANGRITRGGSSCFGRGTWPGRWAVGTAAKRSLVPESVGPLQVHVLCLSSSAAPELNAALSHRGKWIQLVNTSRMLGELQGDAVVTAADHGSP